MLIIEKCIYSDLNNNSVTTGTPPLITNKDAVYYSLHNLLTTVVGERLNEVTYGVNLPDYLFEQIDDTTATELRFHILDAIRRWEPRAEVDLSNTWVEPLYDENTYRIHIAVNLVGIDESSFIITGLYKKQFAKDLMGV